MKVMNKISRKRKINKLLKGDAGWKAKDREMLEDLAVTDKPTFQLIVNTSLDKDEALAWLHNRNKKKTPPRVEDEPRKSSKKKGGKKKSSKKSKLHNARKMLSTILSSMKPKEIVDSMPGRLQEVFGNGLRAHGHNRKRYIDIIVSCKRAKFTKKELRDEKIFPLHRLKQIADLVVNSGNRRRRERDEDDYRPFMGGAGAPRSSSSRREKDNERDLSAPMLPLPDRDEE